MSAHSDHEDGPPNAPARESRPGPSHDAAVRLIGGGNIAKRALVNAVRKATAAPGDSKIYAENGWVFVKLSRLADLIELSPANARGLAAALLKHAEEAEGQ